MTPSIFHEYDRRTGNVGRGIPIDVTSLIEIVEKLSADGFRPFRTPGKFGFGPEFIPIHESNRLWLGYERPKNEVLYDIACFEIDAEDFEKVQKALFDIEAAAA